MLRTFAAGLVLASLASTVQAQVLTFWDTSGVAYANLPQWSTSKPFANQVQIPDNIGAGGTVGFGYQKGDPYAINQNYQGTDYPAADWFWTDELGLSGGQMDQAPGKVVFGTYQQHNFTLKAGQTVNALGLHQMDQVVGTCATACSKIFYTLGFDFKNYNATPLGAPSSGATFGGTYIGFSGFLGPYTLNNAGTTTFQIRAVTLDGFPVDFSGWQVFLANSSDAGGSSMEWTLSPNGFIECNTIVAPGGATILGQGTFGLIRLPSNQRYTQVYFDVVSSQETAVPGTATGDDNYDAYRIWFASSIAPATPNVCVTSKRSYATTWPGNKVAPHKAFTYTATLANSRSANAQGQGSAKVPYTSIRFSMPLPSGVTLKAAASSPKVATTPVINNRVLNWDLNASLKPGRKLKVSLKLVAAACSTPNALTLDGRFSYTDAVGPKTVDACLKKPLSVWAKGCAPIPRPTKPGK